MLKDALQLLAKNIVDDLMLEIERDLATRLPQLLKQQFKPIDVDKVIHTYIDSTVESLGENIKSSQGLIDRAVKCDALEGTAAPLTIPDGYGLAEPLNVAEAPEATEDQIPMLMKKLNNRNFNQVIFEIVTDPLAQNNLKKFFNLSAPILEAFNNLSLYDRALISMVMGSVADVSEGAVNELITVPLTQEEVFTVLSNTGYPATENDTVTADGSKALAKFTKEILKRRRVAEAAQKRLEQINKKKTKNVAPVDAPVAPLPEVTSTVHKEYFTPLIPTSQRIRMGVVGLIPSNSKIIQALFGDTFNLTLVETEENMNRVKSASASCDVVLAMKSWISHKHTENIDRDKLQLLAGGMSTLKSALSEAAKKYYPSYVV